MSRLSKILWISLGVKLLLTAIVPLTSDEAYYYVWSQHMQLSFYDHPPFVAWLFWLGQFVNFYGSMARWPGVLLGQAMLLVWLQVLKPYLNEEQLACWLLMALLSPLLGGTGLIVTPDLPLMFFYGASLWCFYRWREKPNLQWSIAFGLSMGLGFTSKYVMVLFPLSLFPLVYISRELRGPLLKSFGWIFLGGLIGAAPVWIWNLQNDLVSFRFQADHGLGSSEKWRWIWTTDYILVQVGLIFPTILYWALRARTRMPLVFHLMAWVPLLFFLSTTSKSSVEANWPIVAYPSVMALAASAWPKNRRAIQATLGLWSLAFSIMIVVILLQPDWARRSKFREFYEFSNIAREAQTLNPLFARSYQMASKLNYDLKRPVFKLKGMNRVDFYDYLEGSKPPHGIYYLAVEKGDHLPPAYVTAGHRVESVLPVDSRFEIWRVQAP